MNQIFNFDNKFFQFINKITDGFLLSMLWFLFSLPVVTAGAASTALYYAVHKTLRRNRGYLWSSFWSAFKSNLKQATLIWLMLLALFLFIFTDFRIAFSFLKQGAAMGMLSYFFIFMMLFEAVWSAYIFAYCARFEGKLKEILKNTAIMAAAHLPWSFVVLLMLLAGALAVFLSPILILAVPAIEAYLLDVVLEKIFRRYMKKEDLEKEDTEFF